MEHLIQTCQVAALPMRLFYSDPTVARKLVRFAICKKAETIDATVAAIESLYKRTGQHIDGTCIQCGHNYILNITVE